MFSHWIVEGDTTDHGGLVLVRDSHVTVGDFRVATIGDTVRCPKCNVDATIIEADGCADIGGRKIAEVGGLTSCGARLVSIRQAAVGFDNDDVSPPAANSQGVAATLPVRTICEECLDEALTRGNGLLDR